MRVRDRPSARRAFLAIRIAIHFGDAAGVRPEVVAQTDRCLEAFHGRRSQLHEGTHEALCSSPEVRAIDGRARHVGRRRTIVCCRAILSTDRAEIRAELYAREPR